MSNSPYGEKAPSEKCEAVSRGPKTTEMTPSSNFICRRAHFSARDVVHRQLGRDPQRNGLVHFNLRFPAEVLASAVLSLIIWLINR